MVGLSVDSEVVSEDDAREDGSDMDTVDQCTREEESFGPPFERWNEGVVLEMV